MILRLDWCSHEAAKYAVENWHYSRSMPAGKIVKIGAWEDNFIGCVMFSRGSNRYIGSQYGLSQTQVCELARVALTSHAATVTRIVSISLKMLRRQSPDLRLIVSYADPREGHIGAIYQAGNWIFHCLSSGDDKRNHPFKAPSGKIVHWRTMAGICRRYGKPESNESAQSLGYELLEFIPKYKYLYPLDDAMRAQIEPLAKPYPKRGTGETDNAAHSHAQIEGASPIVPLLNHGS